MSDKDDAGVVQFESLEAGDELWIEGERFTVQQIVNNVANLVPKSENGGGKLEYHNDTRLWVFHRDKGIDPEQIRVVE